MYGRQAGTGAYIEEDLRFNFQFARHPLGKVGNIPEIAR